MREECAVAPQWVQMLIARMTVITSPDYPRDCPDLR